MCSSSWASLRSWHSALSSERAPWRRSMSRPFRAHLPRDLRLCGLLFEEPGWRGFALHRQLHGPLIGDLILGSLWALWHLPRLSVPQMLPPVRHGHGLRNVLLGPHRTRLHHTVGLQQYRGSVLMAILTHATWNTFYSAASWRSSPPRRRRQLPEPHHSRVGASYHRRDARAAGLPGSGLSPS
jgi:hypothetical protein